MARKRYKPEEIVGLWLNDGSCIRLRAERADHTWSYDFVHCRTHDGRTAFIAPGSPWENGYIESFNARLRDALLRHFLAAPFQRHPPAQQPGIPAAGPGNDRRAKLAARLRCAPPVTQLGREAVNALTFELDQSPGAGQGVRGPVRGRRRNTLATCTAGGTVICQRWCDYAPVRWRKIAAPAFR